ncbi:hypothetical protein BUALT_Bualt18G0109000 [Buddleja alternifolia]|uniref:Plus3 domain-containing protein n=1 Tax=Buddleja alternifolia TaxID=168488 RepID=A0AAV6WCQ2_9LAMI|nr:hypothetical protein BUALT_Bualt18G0109000 [Buddleja alternifolia]
MADLEKLLLKAAGRTATTGTKRGRKVSFADEKGHSSNDDHAYLSKELSGSNMPPKKRLNLTERYDHERDSDDDSVGSDLYKDEADRETLSKLTELEREMILEARATKRSDREFGKKLKERMTHTRKVNPRPERAGALAELAKRRRDAANRKAITTSTVNSSHGNSGSESQSHDEGESTDDDYKMSTESKVATFDDIKEITIPRTKLLKWVMEPFFDELIAGCFVRIAIGRAKSGPGNLYRLCLVRNVDDTDPYKSYKFVDKFTCKYLNLVWGNEYASARWQMSMVSESPPTKEEFDEWAREVTLFVSHRPTKRDVMEKKEAIEKTSSFVYTAPIVKQMVLEKKAALRPPNIAPAKERLRTDLEIREDNKGNEERTGAKLQELDGGQARTAREQDEKAIKLAEMNRKNKIENFKNASKIKPANENLKAGEDGYDPFSRRWTRPTNYYATTALTDGSGGKATAEAADAGKLVDTTAPVDKGAEPNTLHGFNLSISLATLDKFGGARGARGGYLANKQRIEGTIGVKVPEAENDGKIHGKTLTVDDYKRRMGLL